MPVRNSVRDMPWDDDTGDMGGVYTGDVNQSGEPDGVGTLQYDDGTEIRGQWENGTFIAEQEEDTRVDDSAKPSLHSESTPPITNNLSSTGSPSKASQHTTIDGKQVELEEFHKRNQEFLRKATAAEASLNEKQQEEADAAVAAQQLAKSGGGGVDGVTSIGTNNMNTTDTQQLVYTLQEQVRSLSHELRITQDAHQLNNDQSRAEIELLRTELEHQNIRHEKITSSLRNRLVESETARMKMQDQLSKRVEDDTQREEELKARWKEMIDCVLEDKKWVDEQLTQWKDSQEEHKRRLSEARVRGTLDASVEGGKSSNGRIDTGGDGDNNQSGRKSQRRAWGNDNDDSESSDEEMSRMFGK